MNAIAARVGFPRLRVGDLALPNLDVTPRTGDFARAKEANGEDDDANASKPERFVAEGLGEEAAPNADPSSGSGVDGVVANRGGDDCLEGEKIF